VARVESLSRADDGRYGLLARGTRRLRVERWLPDDPYPLADEVVLGDTGEPTALAVEQASAALARVEALSSELGRPTPPKDEPSSPSSVAENEDAGWALCRRLPAGPLDRQRLLTTDDPSDRLALLAALASDMAEDLVRLLAQA
jgi:Lon protease-like protein